mgnify:CR=1 FL=1
MKMEELVSPVGMNVKAQSFYPEFRDVVKSAFPCVVGNIMSNRIPSSSTL